MSEQLITFGYTSFHHHVKIQSHLDLYLLFCEKCEKYRRKCWKTKSAVRGNDKSDRALVNNVKSCKVKKLQNSPFFGGHKKRNNDKTNTMYLLMESKWTRMTE